MIQLIFAVIILVEILHRWGVKGEWTRKIAHTFIGIMLIFIPWIWTKSFTLLIGVGFTIFFIFEKKYQLLSGINDISRSSRGSWFFPLGITLAAAISWDKTIAFQAAALALAIADTAAWYFGRGFLGIQKPKTWPVSLIFGLVCLGIWLIFAWIVSDISLKFVIGAIYFSLVLTVIEHYSHSGSDNLFIPALAGLFGLIIF